MVVVQGVLEVGRDDVDRLRPIIAEQMAASRAFSGCEHYAIGVDLFGANLLRVSERWRDRAAQAAHLVGDHMARFNIGVKRARIVRALIEVHDGDGVGKLFEHPRPFFPVRPHPSKALWLVSEINIENHDDAAMMHKTEEARAAPGNVYYAIARDLFDERRATVIERWRDRASFISFSGIQGSETNYADADASIAQRVARSDVARVISI